MKKIIRLTESDLTRIVRRVISEQKFDQAAMDNLIAKSQALLGGAVGLKFSTQDGSLVSISSANLVGRDRGLAATFQILNINAGFCFLPDPKNPKDIKIATTFLGFGFPIDNSGVSSILKAKQLDTDTAVSQQSISKLVTILQNVAKEYSGGQIATT